MKPKLLDDPVRFKVELQRHETNCYEDKLFIKFILRLLACGFSGEVYQNPLFYNKNTLHIPDICIPQAGLVLEVDGRTHESNSR
jgi:hypothetical protein